MSRYYDMAINIHGHRSERMEEIRDAADEEWAWDNWEARNGDLHARGESSLAGGETEDEFVDRLAAVVWTANGAYCEVEITATFLDDPPKEIHTRDENDYDDWVASTKGEYAVCT